jgi:hypothetical protein
MQSINVEHQLTEQLWQEKCFGVRFVTLVREKELKINSKPCCFENELRLARSGLRPAQHFYLSNGCAGQKRDSNHTF